MIEFTALMDSLRRKDDAWRVDISDDWLQGRTVYGGLVAALCLEATQREFAGLPALRSAQFSFVGPASGPLQIRPALLRKGKSTVFVGVELHGEAGLAMRATLCFGAARPSALACNTIAPPQPKAPEQCPNLFRDAPENLRFLQHFEGRLAAGHAPFSGATDPNMTLWLRHRDQAARPSLVSLLALADAPPPAMLTLVDKPGPISTMTWMLDMLTEQFDTSGDWWLVRNAADVVAGGYTSQSMTMWTDAGTPVMMSRQNLAVFI
jgi:acyl-CoA thioesterase